MSDMSELATHKELGISFEPLRLDGKQLCAGCEEEFVANGPYCADCAWLEDQLETRRLALAARPSPADQVDMGWAQPACAAVQQRQAARRALEWPGLLMRLIGVPALMVLVWFAFRGLIWFGVWMSQ